MRSRKKTIACAEEIDGGEKSRTLTRGKKIGGPISILRNSEEAEEVNYWEWAMEAMPLLEWIAAHAPQAGRDKRDVARKLIFRHYATAARWSASKKRKTTAAS